MPLTVDEAIQSSSINVETVLSRLAYVHRQIEQAGDHFHAIKIIELMEKVQNQNYSIGFCGHFSAGKSSLINHLFANGLLPTSPIPTSANIVKITNGEERATITFTDGRRVQFDPPFQMEQIKNFCLDGENVRFVEIQHPSDTLPDQVSILDTPGIDSTDDSHRQATESMLHLVDAVFYVMDYNHVLSEWNFNFTKMILDRNVKLFLIINQIDKHRDAELPMETFKEDVLEAFHRWNVVPEAIYYTSLQNSEIKYNELSDLVDRISSLFAEKNTYILDNALIAAKAIISDHLQWIKQEKEHQYTEDVQLCATLSDDQIEAINEDVEQLQLKIEQLENAPRFLEEEFQREFQKLVHNVAFMPYDTRQLAMQFLESTQPSFKVGFIFTEKKTEEERVRRLDALYADLAAKVAAQLDWHVKALLQQLIERYKLNNEALVHEIVDWSVTLDKEVLVRSVKKDAHLNGDYLLNYAKEVSETIKQMYRRSSLQIVGKMTEILSIQVERDMAVLKNEFSALHRTIKAIYTMEHIQKDLQEKQQLFDRSIHGEVSDHLLEQARLEFMLNNKHAFAQEGATANIELPIVSEYNAIKIEPSLPKADREVEPTRVSTAPNSDLSHQLKSAAAKLCSASALVSDITGFSHDVIEMRKKASRLEENQFTVALFGAFSAGKSSFANALMGKSLVPTSPNPTTATITKIKYPTSDYSHGTIRIKVKSNQEMLSDLQHSLHVFHRTALTIEEALQQIDQIHETDLHPKEKPHYSFFVAVKKGYAHFSNRWNEIIELDVQQLDNYVAQEENAAFIEWVDIYYDIPLTAQGITLVDTPGADSIHSRHTGVAFDFIKNADVILYVTYYNHAFSQADQQFLTQLGRVKDAFELDKMFFIVNAVDLAKSKEEVSLVQHYVERNLLSFGIRNPRIYPVSSKLALEVKGQMVDSEINGELFSKFNDSGFPRFEHDFIAFTLSELVAIAMNAVNNDVKRILQKLQGYIDIAEDSENNRKLRLQEVNACRQMINEQIETFDGYSYERSLVQEIKELMYYITQRVNYRMRDAFKVSFSPAVLRKDVSDTKQALRSALLEWIDQLNTEIVQEIQATSLRIEKHMKKVLHSYQTHVTEAIVALDAHAVFGQYALPEFASPEWKENAQHFSIDHYVHVLSLFRSHKHFFENSGNQGMLDELIASLQTPLSVVIEEYSNYFNAYYTSLLKETNRNYRNYLYDQLDQYYMGEIAALSLTTDIQTLKNIQQQLFACID